MSELIISISACPLLPLSRAMTGIQRTLALSSIRQGGQTPFDTQEFFVAARFVQHRLCISHEVSQERFPNDLRIDVEKSWDQVFGGQFQDMFTKCKDFSKRFDSASFVVLNSLAESFEVRNISSFKKSPRVLLVGTDNDNLTPISEIIRLKNTLSDHGFQTQMDCVPCQQGHVSWIFEPDAFVKKVRTFVRDTSVHC